MLGLTRTAVLWQASVHGAGVITMLGDVSTDELSRTTPRTADHRPAVRTPLLRRPWVMPLGC